jgi:hypothetical protein
MDLRIIFFQSLVLGLCVATEKRERERTKEVPTVQKNLAAETKDKKREKKKVSIHVAILRLFCLFCVTTFVSWLASLSRPRTSKVPSLNAYSTYF